MGRDNYSLAQPELVNFIINANFRGSINDLYVVIKWRNEDECDTFLLINNY